MGSSSLFLGARCPCRRIYRGVPAIALFNLEYIVCRHGFVRCRNTLACSEGPLKCRTNRNRRLPRTRLLRSGRRGFGARLTRTFGHYSVQRHTSRKYMSVHKIAKQILILGMTLVLAGLMWG